MIGEWSPQASWAWVGGCAGLSLKAVVPNTEVLWILEEEPASFRVRVNCRSAPTRQKIQDTTAR